MRRIVTAGISPLVLLSTAAAAREPVEIGYLLPKTRVTAGVSQTLTQCPPNAQAQAAGAAGTGLRFSYVASITAKSVPDRLVRIDAISGFLVDRATTVKLTEDGLIKEFNGTAKGQGGPLLTSLIKGAAVGVSLLAGPLPAAATAAAANAVPEIALAPGPRRPVATRRVTAYYLQCTTEAQAMVAKVTALGADIAELEAGILAGSADAAMQQLLTQRRAELVEAQAALTQTVRLSAPLSPVMDAAGAVSGLAGLVPKTDFTKWVEIVAISRMIPRSSSYVERARPTLDEALSAGPGGVTPGLYGYEVAVKIDARSARWFGCGSQTGRVACTADDITDADLRTRDLVYRRPVQATASLNALHAACPAAPCPAAPADWASADEVSASEPVRFGQLSRLFHLPTGGGSIFGSRSVAAEFGASGEPLSLKYERGSASTDIAGVIDASASAAQTVDGARLAATKTRIDEIESAEKLAKLLEADLDAPE